MRTTTLAILGISSTLAFGLTEPAGAQGVNPPGISWEHYQCYRVSGQIPPAASVRLKDQFQSSGARIVRPLFLCNPVQKNNDVIRDPRGHLVCYQIVGPRAANKVVRVQNQFGTQAIKVFDTQLLCVPSLKEVLN